MKSKIAIPEALKGILPGNGSGENIFVVAGNEFFSAAGSSTACN